MNRKQNNMNDEEKGGQDPKRPRLDYEEAMPEFEMNNEETRVSTLITPLLKGAPQTVQNTLSPRSCDQKMNTDHQNNTGDDTSRFLYSQHTVINIDQMQANKDPNYNADYAWSIARMKQDEEERYVQRSRVDILKSLDPNQRILGDIVYPAICQNQRNFPLHQTEINASMHTTLVDWLVELCDKSNIQSTTLCLAIHVMDEYLRREGGVETYRFQLLGCTCLIMAAKEEQIECPRIDDIVHKSNYTFFKGDVIEMEKEILDVMSYVISLPTRTYFLNRFLLAAQVDEDGPAAAVDTTCFHHQLTAITERNYKEASFAYYILDITLQNFGFNQYPMSVVAAAIVHYVKQCYRPLDELLWTPTLVFYTGYEERHLIPVVYALQAFHSTIFNSGYMSVLIKYNCQQYRYCCHEMSLSKERIRFDNVAEKNRFLQEQAHEVASPPRNDTMSNENTPTDSEDDMVQHEQEREMGGNDFHMNQRLQNITPTSFLTEDAVNTSPKRVTERQTDIETEEVEDTNEQTENNFPDTKQESIREEYQKSPQTEGQVALEGLNCGPAGVQQRYAVALCLEEEEGSPDASDSGFTLTCSPSEDEEMEKENEEEEEEEK